MKSPHSYEKSLNLCIQKQLCRDIEKCGGLAAVIKGKGAVTSKILSCHEDLYGEVGSTLRRSVLSKLKDWKRLHARGEFDDIRRALLKKRVNT